MFYVWTLFLIPYLQTAGQVDAAPVPAGEPGGTAGLPGGLHGPGHLAAQLLPASGEHTQGRIVTTLANRCI